MIKKLVVAHDYEQTSNSVNKYIQLCQPLIPTPSYGKFCWTKCRLLCCLLYVYCYYVPELQQLYGQSLCCCDCPNYKLSPSRGRTSTLEPILPLSVKTDLGLKVYCLKCQPRNSVQLEHSQNINSPYVAHGYCQKPDARLIRHAK